MELVVSIPLARLRPVTPSAVEEEMEAVPQTHEHKHHKPKKHKKHKKHSSHEVHPAPHVTTADVLHSPTPNPTPSRTTPAVTPLSGKHLSFSQTHSSPFKFTISKNMPPLPVQGGSSVNTSPLLEMERKGHTHKHKKHHHHHSHQSAALYQSPQPVGTGRNSTSEQGLDVSPSTGGSVGPGGMFSSPEEPLGGSANYSLWPTSRDLGTASQSVVMDSYYDSIDTSSSLQDSLEVQSHDPESQSHDLESQLRDPELQSHDHGSGRSSKKKKKKHKHSHPDTTPPLNPLLNELPPQFSTRDKAEPIGQGLKRGRVSDGETPPSPKKVCEEPLPAMASAQLSKEDVMVDQYTPPAPTLTQTPPSPPVLTTPLTSTPQTAATAPMQGKESAFCRNWW